jgi:pSer/pThr/pTyr-binding forkhead associated (FHA) protein
MLKDLDSLNGTFLNNIRLGKGAVVPLSNLDTLSFGKGVERDWVCKPRSDKN